MGERAAERDGWARGVGVGAVASDAGGRLGVEGAAPGAVGRAGRGGEGIERGEEGPRASASIGKANGGEEAAALGCLGVGERPGGRVVPRGLGDAVGDGRNEVMDIATGFAERAEHEAEDPAVVVEAGGHRDGSVGVLGIYAQGVSGILSGDFQSADVDGRTKGVAGGVGGEVARGVARGAEGDGLDVG